MSRIPQDPGELEAHLSEQIEFLKASAAAYDGGFKGEAKRLAVSMRVLLHKSATSHPLLEQLGRLATLQFFHSALRNTPGNLLSYSGLVAKAFTASGAEYIPMLDDQQLGPGEWWPFSDWWNESVFLDTANRAISRRDIVLALANQDGGAHVDPALNEAYFALTRENSMGWVISRGDVVHPMGPPHLASVRQIAHEVLKTLVPGYALSNPKREDVLMYSMGAEAFNFVPPPSPLARHLRPLPTAPKQGRNELCACGSGKKFKRCHGA